MENLQNPHTHSGAELLAALGVDAEAGLSSVQIEESRMKFGKNSFTPQQKKNLAKRIIEAFCEPMLLLLIFAAVITLGVNIVRGLSGGHTDFLECVGIFIAILLSVVITLVMEGKSAKAFETLRRITDENKVRVLREGQPQMIPQNEVVVGDILCLSTGDRLPADARLLAASDLQTDESALTGESMPVHKEASSLFPERAPVAERSNMLYAGCFVTGGSGTAVVTAVGDHTEFGKIARELSGETQKSTPLQEKMKALSTRITLLGAAAAGLIFLIQVGMSVFQGTFTLPALLDILISSIVLIVAAVPEGLPTIVAVCLAIDIIKMSRQNALVKKMIACETIGCINVICSDKTGTLTQNRMTVVDIVVHGEHFGPEKLRDERMLENFCLNSTADLQIEESGSPRFVGNPTECSLLVAAEKAGVSYHAVRSKADILHVYPFSSETKRMITLVHRGSAYWAYAKGSPEKILAACRLSCEERQQVEKEITAYQQKACRVIAFAHGTFAPLSDYSEALPQIERDMVFDGFVAISDPLRSDVYEAAQRCHSAGIEIKMLTGDHLVTAVAIAEELGLLADGGRAVEAREIEEMSDRELAEALPSIRVIARSTPTVKMRVVKALKSLGNVVAVTGDGINDAPALQNADVGIAMGITGTDVSKQASDIVLLDDSFATIVKAVQWGRGIYENFQRFIQFQLTVNLSSVVVVLVSILLGFSAPFTALELLWINLIMDGPPALTLGLEPIRSDLMKRRPTKRDASIVSVDMLLRIVINGLFISAVFMLQHLTNFLGGTQEQLPTILFTLFVVFQLFNAFNSRALGNESIFHGFGRNHLMLGVFAFTFGLQVVITQFGGAFFGTVPLSLALWVKITLTAASVVLLSEIIKLVRRKLSAHRLS